MDCVKCGAPLPPKTIRCKFCGATNDTDLRSLVRPTRELEASDRKCPDCGELLSSVRLALEEPIVIDRCDTCMGLFFDPGELETVLEESTVEVAEVDLERLDRLAREETPDQDFRNVHYRPCPECGVLMNRRSYGRRSGVIVDVCRDHGVWLDGGELRRLLHWRRAGGEIFDLKRERLELEEEKRELERRRGSAGGAVLPPVSSSDRGELVWDAIDLVDTLRSLVSLK